MVVTDYLARGILTGDLPTYIYLALILIGAIIAICTKRSVYFILAIPIAVLIIFLLGYLLSL